MNALFRYPGSKWSLAQWIISHFPEGYEKLVYLEPFLGSGAVFFNKQPSCVETINDLDGDVVNLFRVLREQPEALARALRLTPYSREEYQSAFEPCQDPLEKARRFVVKTTQAIGARLDGKSGWRNHRLPEIGGSACKWHQAPNGVPEAARRLLGDSTHLVQIEQTDALRLIEWYDSPQCLIYLDPPYLRSTRRGGALYRCELDEDYHKRLLEAVCNSHANILISGYDSPSTGRRWPDGNGIRPFPRSLPQRKQRKCYGTISNPLTSKFVFAKKRERLYRSNKQSFFQYVCSFIMLIYKKLLQW